MKNNIYTFTLIILSLFSCSKNNEENNAPSGVITNYIYKTYNVSSLPFTVIDSTNYQIINDQITNSSSLNLENGTQQSSNYIYINDRITQIQSFNNETLDKIEYFNYDTNNNLIEYLLEYINPQNQDSTFDKHIFNHINDTIFASWTRSDNGVDFNTNISDYKIVLDDNQNRTYFEEYNYQNNETEYETATYDSNSNLLNESKYLIIDNGSALLSFENNYSSNTTENLFNRINEATYTRKNIMLLYHLQSSAVNQINAKSICKNTLNTFESSWGNYFAQFEITNTENDVEQTIKSDFETFVNGSLFSLFSLEYIIQ